MQEYLKATTCILKKQLQAYIILIWPPGTGENKRMEDAFTNYTGITTDEAFGF